MKYFTLFLILCVLANAADECKTGGDTHCEECVNEEKKCGDPETHYCSCCEEGYEPDGALKCKKIACLVEGCQKCVSDNNQKCDTCIANAYEKDGDKCKKACSIDHCETCKSKDECQYCEVGYKLSSDNKKCDEVDCSNNEATHCDKCSDTKDKAQCQICKSGYYRDYFDNDGKCKDLDVCKIVKEGCHVKTETIKAYDPEKCYKYNGQYMKIENEKYCYYEDSGCKTKAKGPKMENKLESCVKIGEKYYKYKEDKDECKVKEYADSKCDNGDTLTTAKCVKNGDNDYILIQPSSPIVTFYTAENCPADKQVKVEAECVDMGCTGGSSGAAINMIILSILIISFMI